MAIIAIVTGTRAEYGLLSSLIKTIHQHASHELRLIATCMHFAPEFGMTVEEIERDGIPISERVETLLTNDSPAAIAKTMGLTTIGFADALQRLKPDLMVVLGDRFEILAACLAAVVAHIPILHLHGGERSEGAIDECFRHAITKLASLHFVAAEPYRQRVIQMGELPERVFNVGAPGLELLHQLTLLNKTQLQDALGIHFGNLNFLVAFHPQSCQPEHTQQQCQELMVALDAYPDANIVMTKSNADENGRLIGDIMQDYANQNPQRVTLFDNLGSLHFLSLMQQVDVMIGNSSSGIIETPALKRPSVNIGERQRGRLRASSVIDCADDSKAIISAIQLALSPTWQQGLKAIQHPYGDGQVSQKILDVIDTVDIATLHCKPFYDL